MNPLDRSTEEDDAQVSEQEHEADSSGEAQEVETQKSEGVDDDRPEEMTWSADGFGAGRKPRSKKIALIAFGAIAAVGVVIGGYTYYDSKMEFGFGDFATATANRFSQTQPSTATKDGAFEQSPDNAELVASSLIESVVNDVLGVPELSTSEQLSEAVNRIQVEHAAVTGQTLTVAQAEQLIGRTARLLETPAAQRDQYRSLKGMIVKAQRRSTTEARGMAELDSPGKVDYVLARVIDDVYGRDAVLPSPEIRAIAKQVAIPLGAGMVEAEQVAQARVNENNLVLEGAERARANPSTADRTLAEVTAEISDQRESAGKSADLDELGGLISRMASLAAITPDALEKAAARMTAQYQTGQAGFPRDIQMMAADAAAAEIDAKALELDPYETALYVANEIGNLEVIDQIAANRGLSQEQAIAIKTHLSVRQEWEQAEQTNTTPEEDAAYIVSSVTGALRMQGVSLEQQMRLAEKVIEVEASRLDLSEIEAQSELARIHAMLQAQDSDLSDIEVIALGERAAVMERQRPNNLTDSGLRVMGKQAAQNVIRSAGFAEATERELLSRTLAFAAELTQSGPGTNRQARQQDDAVAKAKEEATRLGLNSVDREAHIAQAQAVAMAHEAGLDQKDVDVAAVKAQAVARARAMNISESRQQEIGARAASRFMDERDISADEQEAILARISAVTRPPAPTLAQPQRIGLAEEFTPNQLMSREVVDRLSSLEQRMATLSVRVTETMTMAERTVRAAELQAQEFDKRMEVVEDMRSAMNDMQTAMNDQLKTVTAELEAMTTENDRLSKNFGWLSNRTCETEAAVGSFSNPRACEKIYEDYGANDMPQALPAVLTQHHQRVEQVERDIAKKNGNNNSGVQPSRNNHTFAAVPATHQTVAQGNGGGGQHPYANLPRTQARQNKHVQASQNACEDAVSTHRYVTISEGNALLRSQWGTPIRVVPGGYVPNLGAVVHIQANGHPRYIIFENGIVCR